MLPPIQGDDYTELLWKSLDLLKMAPEVQFYVIPPAPSRREDYESVIDCMHHHTANSSNIDPLEYRKRSIYGIGWVGTSIDGYYANQGDWSYKGLDSIKRFLIDCLNVKWPFHDPLTAPGPRVPSSIPRGVQKKAVATTYHRQSDGRSRNSGRHEREVQSYMGRDRRQDSGSRHFSRHQYETQPRAERPSNRPSRYHDQESRTPSIYRMESPRPTRQRHRSDRDSSTTSSRASSKGIERMEEQ